MKSFEQLAQAAYEAHANHALRYRFEIELPTWDELSKPEQEAWVAVAQQLWDEFKTIH